VNRKETGNTKVSSMEGRLDKSQVFCRRLFCFLGLNPDLKQLARCFLKKEANLLQRQITGSCLDRPYKR